MLNAKCEYKFVLKLSSQLTILACTVLKYEFVLILYSKLAYVQVRINSFSNCTLNHVFWLVIAEFVLTSSILAIVSKIYTETVHSIYMIEIMSMNIYT